MIRVRRRNLATLVRRQLDLFALDEAPVLDEAREAEANWNRSGRESAEEAYGDWQQLADTIAERLLDLRETYAATLEPEVAARYRASFDRAAASRYRHFTGLLG